MAESPPPAPVRVVADVYHGTTVLDPYRDLEDFKSDAVQAWVKAQAAFADRTFKSLRGRETLLARIARLDAGSPYTIYGVQRGLDGDLYYFKQLAAENVAKVYRRDGRTGLERLLVDPETLPKPSPDAHLSIGFFRVSPDASRLLYGFAASGSEQTTLQVFELKTGRDLPDSIDRIEADYAPPAWLPDGRSFVYSRRRRLPEGAPPTDGYKFTQAFRHTLGRDPATDELVFAEGAAGSPRMGEMDFPAVFVTPGSNWAVGQIKHGDETDLSLYAAPLAELARPDAGSPTRWTKICDRADQVTQFDVHGDQIFLLTARDAPRFRVVRTSLARPDFAGASTILPAGDYVVQSLAAARDALYVGLLEGVPRKIVRLPYEQGRPARPIELPAEEPSGAVIAADPELDGVLIRTESWTRAGRIYAYEPQTGALADAGLVAPGEFDAPDFITATETFVESHDGVRVPMSIVHRKDLKRDGKNPALLSGYGAYGFTASMRYDPTALAWLERGGVLAVAHVRGGGAYGKAWHHAGRKLTKPNTWKDFIACAEHLVSAGYTSPSRLAGKGGSAGGILVGRSVTDRPDLFAAAHISVGCTEMLRFETTMNGPPNVPEFGTVTQPDEFRALLAMSTYHQIREGTRYPALVFTHGINDPRVEPWISAKTVARFQALGGENPVLFRVDYQAGHGIGSTKRQRHEEMADVWAFLLWRFGDADFAPK